MSPRAQDIKKRIGNRWMHLYRDRFPLLRDAVRYWRKGHTYCPDPAHRGKNGDAFRFFDDADITGGAVCNSCGFFRDGIDVIRWLTGWRFHQTLDFLEEWLQENGDSIGPELIFQSHKSTEPNLMVADYIEETRRIAACNHPRIREYFQHRGLTGNLPRTLGFIENELYQDDTTATYLPAMVTLVRASDGTIVGVHRTYLDPDGPGKAKVKTPKKFFKALYPGALTGSAIRLYRHDGVIGIAEGIEKAVAIAQATGIPMWAAGGAMLLKAFTPPAGVRQVDIWADNDQSWVGQKAAFTLAIRLLNMRIPVRVMIPDDEGDWMDVLAAAGEEELRQAHEQAFLHNAYASGIAQTVFYNLIVKDEAFRRALLPILKKK